MQHPSSAGAEIRTLPPTLAFKKPQAVDAPRSRFPLLRRLIRRIVSTSHFDLCVLREIVIRPAFAFWLANPGAMSQCVPSVHPLQLEHLSGHIFLQIRLIGLSVFQRY